MSMGESFHWFFGIVEDVANDEYKLYRVKVRVLNEHDNVATDDLPWASVMLPTTSSTFQGASDTPALAVGAMVFGFFADGGKRQLPIVVASLPVFTDNDENKHSLSMLARGKQTLEKELIGPEPESPYAAEYPFNKVTTTRAGHVIELDDTEGAERIHIYHKSGSYVEIGPDGRVIIKSANDSFHITNGESTLYSVESMNIVSGGNIRMVAKDGVVIDAPGGMTLTEGSIFTKGNIGSKTGATGAFSTPTGQTIHVINGSVVKIEPKE